MNFRTARAPQLLIAAAFLSIAPFTAMAQSPLQVLHDFTTISKGVAPQAALVRDQNGVLYGTTSVGGDRKLCQDEGCGTVFSLTPPGPGQTSWKHRVLHTFTGPADNGGSFPLARLFLDKNGALFGTAFSSGSINANDGKRKNLGLVFKLTPPAAANREWRYDVIHVFAGGRDDGANPTSGVIADESGALYGATGGGGANDIGTVYKLTPPATGTRWTVSVLQSFSLKTGAVPIGGLAFDQAGNLYGTSRTQGAHGTGSLWRLSPPPAGKNGWHLDVLHQFKGAPDDGGASNATLLVRNGVVFGVTSEGGPDDSGVIFSFTPPAAQNRNGEYRILHRFIKAEEGSMSSSELVSDRKGALYGATASDGPGGEGALFRLSPPKPPATDWKLKILFRFQGDENGGTQKGGLVRAKDGLLYGAAQVGGTRNRGIVFSFKP